VVNATVAPSGLPTLVHVEQGGERQPLTHFAQPSSPDVYSYWRRFDAAFTGSWRIVAERGDARAGPAVTPALALDDLEDGRLENRSSTFAAPYTVSR
jgi:hypothetical protein